MDWSASLTLVAPETLLSVSGLILLLVAAWGGDRQARGITWLTIAVLFGAGLMAEVGRGGAYTVAHSDGRQEAAIGFSLYPDPLIDLADEGVVQRIFLALGTDASTGAKLRSDGWITVAALDENDDAVLLGCTHKWTNGQAIPV